MAKRIHKYLFYTLLTIVYGIFFSVESFYNFEGHSDAKKILSQSSFVCHSKGTGTARTSATRFPSSHTIRLNKRYQQENFPPCPIFRVKTSIVYVTPVMLEINPIQPLPLVTIDHSPLRGPPFAA
jgi:hypothetical protein